jgi:hypothetical protein
MTGCNNHIIRFWGDRVNRYETKGTGHRGVASGTRYHSGRQDGSSRCTITRCSNHIIRFWGDQVNRYKTKGTGHKGVASGT